MGKGTEIGAVLDGAPVKAGAQQHQSNDWAPAVIYPELRRRPEHADAVMPNLIRIHFKTIV
jgi:hypothetical protein